ncbi:MAG: hypothetical protein HY903_08085 [Deltaproteobacteria bacterium]|nr:hypothetical protein [Deltaproteobacteria bacterium]
MSIPYRARPGAGFVLVTLCLGAAAALSAWGLKKPTLERVWEMQIQLGLGARKALSAAEFDLLQQTMLRYPELVDNLLEGRERGIISANEDGVVEKDYAYLVVRGPRPNAAVEIGRTGTGRGGNIGVRLKTATGTSRGATSVGEKLVWRLPPEGPFPQLVEVRLDKPAKKKKRRQRDQVVIVRLVELP